ncbi:hypothetical protein QYG89_08475 [Bacillus sp. B190/17]|uniref:Uncharacterized protein n=1 Tax=Bacillus lumedeiriae TaxID=3058829 RepID=A0ABW8I9M1_9BACI
MERRINDQVVVKKMNEHFCLVREGKGDTNDVELCFYSLVDALSYASERNY